MCMQLGISSGFSPRLAICSVFIPIWHVLGECKSVTFLCCYHCCLYIVYFLNTKNTGYGASCRNNRKSFTRHVPSAAEMNVLYFFFLCAAKRDRKLKVNYGKKLKKINSWRQAASYTCGAIH